MKQFILMACVIAMCACKKAQPSKPIIQQLTFKNVLILGNSITYSPASPWLGWYNNCGMAATVADSDYVHLLTAKFKKINPYCVVTATNIAGFEQDWTNYDINANLQAFKNLKPDLIILRIGENVTQVPLDTIGFGRAYQILINYFDNKPLILGVGSFWSKPVVDAVMAKYSSFFSLASVSNEPNVYSFGLWSNFAVELHPSNTGMRLIADSIWVHVNRLR